MALDVADDEVEQTVAVPIRDRDGRGAAGHEHLFLAGVAVSLAVKFDVMAFFIFLEFGVAGDGDAIGRLADIAADVDDVAVLVAELFRRAVRTVGLTAEDEDFAGPGAGDDVLDAVAVEVRKLRTEADASARGHAALFLALLEFHSGRVFRLRVRADVLVKPEDAFAELADEQIVLAVAVKVDDQGRRVADVGVDRLSRGFQSDRRSKLVGGLGRRLLFVFLGRGLGFIC